MTELIKILKGGRLAIAAMALLCLWACNKTPMPETYKDTIYSDRKVMIVWLAGHNSLSSAITDNFKDLINGTDFHTNDNNADAILVFTHTNSGNGTPYLIYPHRDTYGDLVLDTLITFSSNTISASAKTMYNVLTYIKDNFPADEYGLIFSSHGRGYLPAGYYNFSSKYEDSYTVTSSIEKARQVPGIFNDPIPVPGIYDPYPLTRSIGEDYYSTDETYEINLEDFAEALPMNFKYIVFDACLMGGIEVAYQLRNKIEYLIASPTEILAAGMDYATMASYLMARPEGDFQGFCENYYARYINSYGTISLTDCTQLEPLAELCHGLFSKYRVELDNIDYSDIQKYYTYSYHWFFDMEDIIEHLGCTDEELAEFNALMDECVLYNAYTRLFISFAITKSCGLSMMLPNYAGDYLKDYYKTNLDWNFATSLVE